MRTPPPGCVALAVFGLLFLIPFLFAEALLTALEKLGLSQRMSLVAALGIFFGGMVNVPIRRIEREKTQPGRRRMFGLDRLLGGDRPDGGSETLLAVNVGGCLIPLALALYQIVRLTMHGPALVSGAIAVTLNVAVCYGAARPVPNVGIAMPAFMPALVAAGAAIILQPDFAPPVAFTAGVLGPLIGADLLHLREIRKTSTGIASIGGAGTFDGIVLSGLVATLLS